MVTALSAAFLALLLFILSIRVIGLRGSPAFAFIAHKGNFSVNADKAEVKLSGKQIILDASREIVIQAPKIRIGYEEKNCIDWCFGVINATGTTFGDWHWYYFDYCCADAFCS